MFLMALVTFLFYMAWKCMYKNKFAMYHSPEGFVVHQYSCPLHPQLGSTGVEFPHHRIADFYSKYPPVSPVFTSEAPSLDPTSNTPNNTESPENMENNLLFHIWKTLKNLVPPGRLRSQCYWIRLEPNLTGSAWAPVECLSGPCPSSPSFHHCPSGSFQLQWSLCSVDGRNPSVKRERGKIRF